MIHFFETCLNIFYEAFIMAKSELTRGKKHLANPFLADASINSKSGTKRLSNRKGDKFMIVSDNGETVAPAGFHEIVEVDKTQFVKLYINGVKAFQGLKSAGAKVFEIIYRSVQDNAGTDRIYLHFMEVEQNITPISRATFFRGMTELIERGFIAESQSQGMYFLNIDYLFNGNRLAFIKEYRVKAMDDLISNSIAKRDLKTPDMFE